MKRAKPSRPGTRRLSRFFSQYGMLAVLLLLGALFSILTLQDQHPTGGAAASRLAAVLTRAGLPAEVDVLVVGRSGEDDTLFARTLADDLAAKGFGVIGPVNGDPAAIRAELTRIGEEEAAPRTVAVATLDSYAAVARGIVEDLPGLHLHELFTPPTYRWPTFLLPENLLNVANQIAVIAILAIGMTMVIIAGGIDLSVGSLIALAAVVTAGLIGKMGGTGASVSAMFLAGGAAMLMCGAIGGFSGLVITRFQVPPFIATLGMMQVASGLAYIISQGKPIYQIPDSFITLGRGADPFLHVPYAVLLMLVLYLAAHLMMSHTKLGRHIYAAGGNAEAARLSGVRVKGVLMFVFAICGVLTGLGGVVMASQLKSGAPTYGLMYELYVIAAVVVGGTSLRGGEGRILGTLIGVFIIAVIQNGMNLTNVESYTQKVVLGLVILGAVLLDRLKHREWFWQRRKKQG